MGMTYLDLKPYFNLKMVYPDNTTFVPGESIGIHNLIVEERNYLFGETKKDGRQALFEKNDKGDHLINCAAQKIRAERCCDRVHVFGFNTWGIFQDRILIESDGGFHPYTIGFSDVKWNVKSENRKRLAADRRYYAEFGDVYKTYKGFHAECDDSATVFMYCKTIELESETYIKKIILPDNPLMYISAITLEKKSSYP